MIKHLSFLLLALAGCQASPQPMTTPAPATVPPIAGRPVPLQEDAVLERKVRQQAQYIEALLSQNEALTARVAVASVGVPPPSPMAQGLTNPSSTPPAESNPPSGPKTPMRAVQTPNAAGIIDLAALALPVADEPVNPFAVRTVPPDSIREVTFQIGGIIAGPVACAVINERLVLAGDTIESLSVESIESDAVILTHGNQRLRLPVGGKTLRVRLPL